MMQLLQRKSSRNGRIACCLIKVADASIEKNMVQCTKCTLHAAMAIHRVDRNIINYSAKDPGPEQVRSPTVWIRTLIRNNGHVKS
jgi:hypothetical protein